MITGKKYFIDAIKNIPPEITKQVDMQFNVSDKLFSLMKESNVNKSSLARKMHVLPETISVWLSGQHDFTISELAGLSSVFQKDFVKLA